MRIHFFLSLAANASRVILGFVFFWQVSRALGLETLGEYLYVTAALGYFGSLIDYGFNLFVLNTASRSEGAARPLFLRVVLSKLILTAVSACILLVLYPWAFATHGMEVTALFFAGLVLQSFFGLFIHFYKAMGRFDFEFAASLLASALPVALLFIIGGQITIRELAWIVLIVRLMVVFYQLALFLRLTKGQAWINFDDKLERFLDRALKDIQRNFKYAVFSVLGAVFLSVDLVVMRFVLGPEEVSIYGTAMKVVLAAILFFEVLNGTFIPRLARSHQSGDDRNFRLELRRFSAIMVLGAILISILMIALGKIIIVWAFGGDFALSGDIVKLLAFVFVLRVMEMTTGPILTVYGQQGFRARSMVIVFPLHIGGNLLLQSLFGIWGAAYALIFSFLLLFALNSTYLWRAMRHAKGVC